MTDYNTKYDAMIDAEALALIGRVFDSVDLQQPAVIMTAFVTRLKFTTRAPQTTFVLVGTYC